MEDFNWLKKQASPNWRIMAQDRHEELRLEAEVLRNGKFELSEELNKLCPWADDATHFVTFIPRLDHK